MQPDAIISSLSHEARTLVRTAVDHLRAEYDPDTGLVTDTLEGTPFRNIRNSMYLALGLLILDEPDAPAIASQICETALRLQIIAPHQIYHGVFRHPDDPMPPELPFDYTLVTPQSRYHADLLWEKIADRFDAELRSDPALCEQTKKIQALLRRSLLRTVPVAWDTYEPNLREFIGMTFAMLLEHFTDRLSPDLVQRIRLSCRSLMEGARMRSQLNLTPLNTNIRIMHIFLLDEFGRILDEPEWIMDAEREAASLTDEYTESGGVAEFNSPTYCGVDLSILGFFRQYSDNQKLIAFMDRLEERIWADMAEFYNPQMRAFCGPYSRSYELDMSVHTCFYDLLYLGLGEERFPWHPYAIEGPNAPLTVLGDVHIPTYLKDRFLGKCTPRHVHRTFRELSERGNPAEVPALCQADAFISPDFMAGAMRGSRNTSHQLHPLVVFWRDPATGNVGTMKLLRCLEDGEMCHLHLVTIDCVLDASNTVRVHAVSSVLRPVVLFFELACPDLHPDSFTETVWHLPGMEVHVQSSLPMSIRAVKPGVVRVAYRLAPDSQADLCISLLPASAESLSCS